MSDGPRLYGKYRATVMNTLDPENKGRIQVQLSDHYGLFPSTWALPCFPLAGRASSGFVALPELGAAVWLEFEAGDPDRPIWSGGFYEDGSIPTAALVGATPATPNVHMQTTGGSMVTLSDNLAQQVVLKSITGAAITFTATGIKISSGFGAEIELQGISIIINNGALRID